MYCISAPRGAEKQPKKKTREAARGEAGQKEGMRKTSQGGRGVLLINVGFISDEHNGKSVRIDERRRARLALLSLSPALFSLLIKTEAQREECVCGSKAQRPQPSPEQAAKSIKGPRRIFITKSDLITLYLAFNTSSKTKRVCVRVCVCVCAACMLVGSVVR